ncbi:MAG: DEAD/DEAH box helicase family protein [Polyangiaceae bacterium]
MITSEAAKAFLDFGARIGAGQRADEQLQGAVALHNILQRERVAYLADEVGMGKTYVACGVVALFRHFQPNFRVLIIAPRKNIQTKWMKEFRNFVTHNVCYADGRVKALDGGPTRPLIYVENLLGLVHETTLNPNRDFFVRLSSFSLPLAGREAADATAARRLRDGLRTHLPWVADEVFDLRHKQAFKDNVARAICCALPRFDLVIVDEGHNLKHGFAEHSSARNRVLALSMGHSGEPPDKRLFPGYERRAERVLFLSATPVEESYRQLWNQLDLFDHGHGFGELRDKDAEEQKQAAKRFFLRRVTSIRIGKGEYTKNLYRREWRNGGVMKHDDPIHVQDIRQRLVVALVQKKVSELLGHERFNRSFQVGMLASFESFLETAKLKAHDDQAANFDDQHQTDDELERQGIDIGDVNRLARSYREMFGGEMPHPKMDALVSSLSGSWESGRKALIFVRRVASVKELKRKLDDEYDEWLIAHLREQLPDVRGRLDLLVERYRQEKLESRQRDADGTQEDSDDEDSGGIDTFFAWFFRGDGPKGVVSGANVQQRFVQRGANYSTFFEDNHVAALLGCRPAVAEERLREALNVDAAQLRQELKRRSAAFLPRTRKPARADRFEAVQAAAIEWLKDSGPYQEEARVVWHQRFEASRHKKHTTDAPDIGDWLRLETFFTELRTRPELRRSLWPEPTLENKVERFRERELRRQLLASSARLGHAFIDLYVMTIRRLGSLELRAQESSGSASDDAGRQRIAEYLDLLDTQRRIPLAERRWSAFDELEAAGANFELILDVNLPEARTAPLGEAAVLLGRLLRKQQPVGGMSGQVNQTLVRQFRMPGYPLVLVSTDVLQEGEDLHTFCSSVYHYGISWTSSSMEQRTGRVDRVRSQTDRRLCGLNGDPQGEELLQVYYPFLTGTVEVLQVRRVLERMNTFLELMHEGIHAEAKEERTIDTLKEFQRANRPVPQIRELLRSAFPVLPEHLSGPAARSVGAVHYAAEVAKRFRDIKDAALADLAVTWEPPTAEGQLLGTAHLTSRVQPFSLLLSSVGMRPLIRCISPVGRVGVDEIHEALVETAGRHPMRLGIVETESGSYDLTVEDAVLLAEDTSTDASRVATLIRGVVARADQLERERLHELDQGMDVFESDLQQERTRGR